MVASEADEQLTALEHERRRLAEEQSFLQALLDSLDTGVVACDHTGRLALFNQALLRMLGSSIQPLDAETWLQAYEFRHPDGRTPLAPEDAPLARAFAGRLVEGQELVVAAPGLAPRRMLVNGRPIDTGDGRRVGAVIALHDITHAHRAEVLRRAQHAVAQALSEAASAEEAATAAIAAVAGELGWPSGEYWETGESAEIVLAGKWGTGSPASAELPAQAWRRRDVVVADGSPARVALPVRSGGTVLGVLTFALDSPDPPHAETLTMLEGVCDRVGRYLERRRSEDLALALAAARRDFSRVMEQVDDYVWTVEIAPGGAVRSVYASPNGTAVFGDRLPTDEDLAITMDALVHPDDRHLFADFHASVCAGRSAEIECRLIGFDGVTRWVWTRGFTREEGGRLFVDGISTNVTERRELADKREELLVAERQQVMRLRELDRLKDELVAVVSHELRNPIGAIRGYTELMLDDPGLPPENREHVKVIDRKSAQLKQIVDDLLDLARLDAGHVDLRSGPLALGGLVREALADHQPAAASKELTVVASVADDLPIHGDAQRLRQVLDNLLSNAVKYTPAGGRVTVTARRAAQEVELVVSDTGIGVPAEQLPRLFTRFFRASTALEHGIGGTGLGLAVTKAIVEAHAGTITAEPGAVTGTTFRVRLPAGPGAPVDPPRR